MNIGNETLHSKSKLERDRRVESFIADIHLHFSTDTRYWESRVPFPCTAGQGRGQRRHSACEASWHKFLGHIVRTTAIHLAILRYKQQV